ncbi:hypothetical protein [Roseococcus sp. YIM B11640]|uniref:hypothetical protein n=1 Tax=Roseococcus sp. YIM B11640 TaxID=3133973 RepID=UPI003C7E5F19
MPLTEIAQIAGFASIFLVFASVAAAGMALQVAYPPSDPEIEETLIAALLVF